jgi:hypothetical protein
VSDGTYRDDHEAAVYRARALDRELDQVRAERDAARAERDALRERLRTRFAPMPPLPMRRGRAASPASLAGGVSLLTVGLIAAAVATSRMETPSAHPVVMPIDLQADLPMPAPRVAEFDPGACIEMSRQLEAPAAEASSNAAICAAILDGVAWDPSHFSTMSRMQALSAANALHELHAAVDHQHHQHTADAALATSHAVDDVHAAAQGVDLGALRPRF